jgi:hypothetical protein
MWNKIENIGLGAILGSMVILMWVMITFAIVHWNELPEILKGM